MSRRPKSSEEINLLEKAAKYFPGASTGNLYFNEEDSLIIKEGKGTRVYDYSGNEYIDYLLGSGPMILGHSHPAVLAAVEEALSRGSTYFTTNGAAVELAEEIVDAVPCAEKIRFFSSGSEATFNAMRVARAYRKRDKIVKFEGGYHGISDYAEMSSSPLHLKDFPIPTPDSAGIPKVLEGEMLICPYNDIETTSAIIERHQDEIGGVIVEPHQRIIPPKPGFLEGLREVTSHYHIPLIFDEIVTGFRWSYGGAQEYYGVTPDLTALGKAIGGGYAISAIVGKEEMMRVYDPIVKEEGSFVPGVGTLNGNPIATTAGLATLKELKKPGTYDRIFATGDRIKSELSRLLKEMEIPGVVSGDSPNFDVYFGLEEAPVDHRSTLGHDRKMLERFNHHMLDSGVLKGDQKFYISAVHSKDDVDRTLEAMAYAMERAKG
jgi:glutamate-1-semialdehyde 2,1-aminomutase